MTIAELKVDILQHVAATNDKTFLSDVLAYIQNLRKNRDWWDELDEAEIASIEEGNRQLENGEGIPHEEVRKKVQQILGK
jgi:predicted transcriptional regulator